MFREVGKSSWPSVSSRRNRAEAWILAGPSTRRWRTGRWGWRSSRASSGGCGWWRWCPRTVQGNNCSTVASVEQALRSSSTRRWWWSHWCHRPLLPFAPGPTAATTAQLIKPLTTFLVAITLHGTFYKKSSYYETFLLQPPPTQGETALER